MRRFKFFSMKKLLPLIFVIPIVFFVICLAWWKVNTEAPGGDIKPKTFVISRGASVIAIGNNLKRANLIKSALAFKIYIQVTGKQNKVQAGEYLISSDSKLTKIVDQFVRGPDSIWVTIPEGLRREEIARKVGSTLGMEGEKLTAFKKEFYGLTKDKEGFLFPDTYLFLKTASASAVVNKLYATFNLKVDDVLIEDINASGYSLDEIITIASLVERETLTESERPIVAGIIIKRLKKGWPLQIDASLQYLSGSQRCNYLDDECKYWEIPGKNELEIKSSFNTYKYAGLPPSAICSPGISSIKAAVYPQESEYWFYLHDGEGKIHFAKTLEEHNLNISKYLY